jgi:ATP-dependent DNA ligase
VILLEFNDIIGKLYPQRAKGVEADKIPWDNKNYTFQVKEDGDRRLLYFTKDGVLNSSRSKGADTGLPVTKTDNTPHIRDLNIPELEGTIIDCEFIHNRGFQEGVRKIMGCLPEKAIQRQNDWGLIEVYIFDVLSHNGEFIVDMPLHNRMRILEAIYETYFKDIPFFRLVKTVEGSKEELIQQFEELIANGGEGFVAKDINSTYRLSTEKCQSPLKNAWIKVKREFNGDFVVMGFDKPSKTYTGDHLDTHQYWYDEELEQLVEGNYYKLSNLSDDIIPVTKYHYKGWIGSIKFGEYENDVLVERGNISGMDESLRAEISANPESYIGKVVEVDGMERIKKTKAIRQPVFKRFRDDKLPEECIYENQKG